MRSMFVNLVAELEEQGARRDIRSADGNLRFRERVAGESRVPRIYFHSGCGGQGIGDQSQRHAGVAWFRYDGEGSVQQDVHRLICPESVLLEIPMTAKRPLASLRIMNFPGLPLAL